MNTMQVEVVSSEQQIFSGKAEYVVAPAINGDIGIYPRHIALISKLKAGLFRIKLPDQEEHRVYAISGGFVEVQSSKVTVLADIVERTDDLDEARLLEQKQAAEQKIKSGIGVSQDDTAKAYANLELVIAQLKALDYLRKHTSRS